jgi:XTP/dITP diphosphohydrolase
MTSTINIVYSTINPFKKAEIEEMCRSVTILAANGKRIAIGDEFKFEFRDGSPSEPLERDLEQMVKHKVVSAYKNLMVPCIVEHAGLIFDDYFGESYPGGLTQPMWDALAVPALYEAIFDTEIHEIARAQWALMLREDALSNVQIS